MRIVPLFARHVEIYKDKYENFQHLAKNCPFAPQASICSHVPKSSSQKGCMNLSLNSVFSKCIANSDFPTPLELSPFSTVYAIHLFKNSTWWYSRTGKKQALSCSCLRSPNRTRITRCRTYTLFPAPKQGHSSRFPAHPKCQKNSLYKVVKFQGKDDRFPEVMNEFARA